MSDKKQTVKQLRLNAARLLKGIDNSSVAIRSHQNKIGDYIPELQETLSALSNTNGATTVSKVKQKIVKAPKDAKKSMEKDERPPLLQLIKDYVSANGGQVLRKDLTNYVINEYNWSRLSLALQLKKTDIFNNEGSYVKLVSKVQVETTDDSENLVSSVAGDQTISQAL